MGLSLGVLHCYTLALFNIKTSMKVFENMGSILLQSKEKEKKCDEGVSAI
jgi:hypothetical protein